jgi:hypothetical protein
LLFFSAFVKHGVEVEIVDGSGAGFGNPVSNLPHIGPAYTLSCPQ